jgi:Alternative oxidase
MDLLYGRKRSRAKFKVLEIVARVPYQAWEQVAYITLTHRYNRLHFARRAFERVNESRAQQDNEQWHLLIIQELLDEGDEPDRLIRHRLVPQAIAFAYFQLSVVLFIVRPKWSNRLNADFEDHAEHEYARFVEEKLVAPTAALRRRICRRASLAFRDVSSGPRPVEQREQRQELGLGIGPVGRHDDAGCAALGAAHADDDGGVARIARAFEAVGRLDHQPIRGVHVRTRTATETVVVEEELAAVAGRFEKLDCLGDRLGGFHEASLSGPDRAP